MKELEPLLNTLIQMGWKPWNVDVNCDISIKIENNRIKIYFELKTGVIVSNSGGMSLRELVSLESGLCQFVCDKELYSHQYRGEFKFTLDGVIFDYYQSSYKFRLLESALVPEEELGQFLVDNIMVGGKKE